MAKALSRKVTIYINGKEIENTLSSLKGEMVKLQNQQKKMVIGSEEYVETSLKIREIKSVLREQEDAVRGLGDAWKDTRTKLADYSNMLMGVQSAFQMIDLGVGKLKDLAKDAAALDDVYADVMKTTGLTHEQVEKLNEIVHSQCKDTKFMRITTTPSLCRAIWHTPTTSTPRRCSCRYAPPPTS